MAKGPVPSHPMTRIFAQMVRVRCGCWEWQGSLYWHGYGQISARRKKLYTHRVSYEYFYETTIDPAQEIDHLCSNRICVNPLHLEMVSHRVNLLRAESGIAAKNAKKTHCPSGHAYDVANTGHYVGGRKCRHCARIRSAARYRKMTANNAYGHSLLQVIE
jgi:hypothetical protein